MGESRTAIPGQPNWLRQGQVPSLDGLRGVSITLVLAAHLLPSRLSFAGNLGVDLFFLISGFIITLLLLREQERTGALSLKNFYLRRALRILPAYAAFLLGAFALTRFGLLTIKGHDWLPALTYTVGFVRVPRVLEHLWSLSTEEHFYLVWPVVLCLLPRRAAVLAVGLCVALGPVARLLIHWYFSDFVDANLSTPARMDGLAAGCLLAFVAWSQPFRWATRPMGRRADLLAAFAAAVCLISRNLLARTAGEACYRALDHSCYILCLSVIVWVGLYHPAGLMGRLLNSRLLMRVGLLSYSLYLWQQPFCFAKVDSWAFRWPANVCVTICCALASYYMIESPFLRLRNSFRARIAERPAWFPLPFRRLVSGRTVAERQASRLSG
jgi:peptidoglycan/LPS O-acetylase OafA/YrhL